ncbi:MAG: hypothetical protein ACI8UD_000083 [Planctomycetota bacterium]|jgi:uncharacterized protein with NRDE domain
MCSLIVLRGLSVDYPLIIAANRDEQTGRKAAPPGIWEGERRRILSPRDRVAGGTWLCVNDLGHFAGLTNVIGEPSIMGAPSRGHLPHLALDHDDVESGVQAVLKLVREHQHSGFQLVVADRDRMVVIRNAKGQVSCDEWLNPVLSLTNEHAAGDWSPRHLDPALAEGLAIDDRLHALATAVCDRGGDGFHTVCKHGENYATVSSSLVAVPGDDSGGLIWRYAAGPPDVTSYRNYSNLAARLRPES